MLITDMCNNIAQLKSYNTKYGVMQHLASLYDTNIQWLNFNFGVLTSFYSRIHTYEIMRDEITAKSVVAQLYSELK